MKTETRSSTGTAAPRAKSTKKKNAGRDNKASAARRDEGRAFLPDPYAPDARKHPARAGDELAETLAEEYVAAATSGEEQAQEAQDELVADEIGGPFVETAANEEFAAGVDEANPEGAAREPFPTANARQK